jgi:hypothetical protein
LRCCAWQRIALRIVGHGGRTFFCRAIVEDILAAIAIARCKGGL